MSISSSFCFGEPHACSFKKCCFFLFIFILFVLIAIVAVTLIFIFILKPQKPVFILQSMRLNSYNLKAYSDSTLLVSSVVTLILNARNPNMFGLKYRPSRLHLYFQGLRIGLVRVPGFYQATHSDNMSVTTQILVDCVNVTEIIYGGLLRDKLIHMELLGDVGLQVRFFRFSMPKIEIAIDCNISFDYTQFIFNAQVFNLLTVQHPTEYIDPKSKSFSINCSPALNI